MRQVEEENAEAEKQRVMVSMDEKICAEKAKEAEEIQNQCTTALSSAEPKLE